MRKYFRAVRLQFIIVVLSCTSIIALYVESLPSRQLFVPTYVQGIQTVNLDLQVVNPIDFDAYWNINKDVYAYLYIDDTKIDYPVLQHPDDNSHYLNYTIDGMNNYPGSIYSEKETSKDFKDPNTIIYGHNMSATYGTMFYDLTRYGEEDFFKNHRYIYIYTPDKIYQYQVFAAYPFDNRHLLYHYDFKDKDIFQAYIEGVFAQKQGVIDKRVEVHKKDNILTLSTCTNSNDDRFLVQAVLKESIICRYKTAVSSNISMANMKVAERVVNKQEEVKQDLTYTRQIGTNSIAALPYVFLIFLIVFTFLYSLHKKHRTKEEQAFYDRYVKSFSNKLRFIRFLTIQLFHDLKILIIQNIKKRS